jgi:hypothetical protein
MQIRHRRRVFFDAGMSLFVGYLNFFSYDAILVCIWFFLTESNHAAYHGRRLTASVPVW